MTTALHLLGAGRAGTALARRLAARGHAVGPVVTRRASSAAEAVRRIGAGRPATDPGAVLQAGAVVLLAVPDRELAGVVSLLAHGGPLPGCVALHLSGALSAEVLSPLRARGVAVGKLHPMYAFVQRDAPPPDFDQVGFAIQGDPAAVECARHLVADLGGVVLELEAGADALHHAACSVASNALVAVFQLALDLERAAGVNAAQAAPSLLSLVESTVRNLRTLGSPAALTGPIERGETDVVREHLQAIRRAAPDQEDLYRRLALATLGIAVAKGSVTAAAAQALRQALGPTP